MTKEKKIKVKKIKLDKRICCICGLDTDDYIIYNNGFICKKCTESSWFIKLKGG